MSWIPSYRSLGSHWKLRKMSELLGISEVATVGHLHYLWWWAVESAKDGDLSRFDAMDLAVVSRWCGEPAAFLSALVAAGFVDRDGNGRLLIHDWDAYGGRLLNARARNAERMRRHRRLARNHHLTTPSQEREQVDNQRDAVAAVPSSGVQSHEVDDQRDAAPPQSTVRVFEECAAHVQRTCSARAAHVQNTCNARAAHVQRTCSARLEPVDNAGDQVDNSRNGDSTEETLRALTVDNAGDNAGVTDDADGLARARAGTRTRAVARSLTRVATRGHTRAHASISSNRVNVKRRHDTKRCEDVRSGVNVKRRRDTKRGEDVAVVFPFSAQSAEKGTGPSEKSDGPDVSRDEVHPFSLFEALCDELGAEASSVPRRELSKQLAVAKRLVGDGATPEDIRRQTRWLMSQSWVSGVDLFLIEKQRVKWLLAGQPEDARWINRWPSYLEVFEASTGGGEQ